MVFFSKQSNKKKLNRQKTGIFTKRQNNLEAVKRALFSSKKLFSQGQGHFESSENALSCPRKYSFSVSGTMRQFLGNKAFH